MSDSCLDDFVPMNFNSLECMRRRGPRCYVTMVNSITIDPPNRAPCGIEVCEMANRILTRVLLVARAEGVEVCWTGRGALSVDDSEVPRLAQAFERKYGRTLLGEGLGQFLVSSEGQARPSPDAVPSSAGTAPGDGAGGSLQTYSP